jgi:hypothetical protein
MRRIDPTLIGLSILAMLAAGLVASFLVFSSIVSQDDARLYPPSPAVPVPVPISTYPPAATGPVLDPRPPAVSQTLDDITIRVQPRYADSHRVVLTYTISGPMQSYPYQVGLDSLPGNWPRLILDDGTELQPDRDGTPEDQYFAWLSVPSGAPSPWPNDGLLAYDTSALSNPHDTLTMRLTMPIAVNNTPYLYPSPIATGIPGVPNTPTIGPTTINGPPPNKTLNYTFDLTTQVDKRCRLAQPGTTVEKAGVRITLNYVSITASETRLNLSYAGTFNNNTVSNSSSWHAAGTMDTGPGTPQIPLWNNCDLRNCGSFTGLRYRGQSLLDTPESQWLLKVDTLANDSAGLFINGPWVFKFDMPANASCTARPTP